MSGEPGVGEPQDACWVRQWNEHELRPCWDLSRPLLHTVRISLCRGGVTPGAVPWHTLQLTEQPECIMGGLETPRDLEQKGCL